ncbi:hypothetical protein O3646_07965 [Streptococcus sp. 27098_8_148]|uniref:hypothetical protein n=1 Tax=Streptococcus sp. 27098_8_148 TaxID=3003652 RepID=UPI00352E681F
MVGKDGIVIKDGQISLNSGEKLSIENPREEPLMKERIKLTEGEVFLLTPPYQSDPCFACHLIYLSYETKGLCAYVLSKEVVNLEDIDIDSIEFDTKKAIYSSTYFMKWGLWKKLGNRSILEEEDQLLLRNVGNYNLMYRDENCRQMPSKKYKEEYPLQPVYDSLEVFALIYGKKYKESDPRVLDWMEANVKTRLDD